MPDSRKFLGHPAVWLLHSLDWVLLLKVSAMAALKRALKLYRPSQLGEWCSGEFQSKDLVVLSSSIHSPWMPG